MGCAGCTKERGCEAHKAPQRQTLDEVIRRIYPSGRWGQPDDEARFLAGIREREARRLAKALSVAAKAPSYYRPAGPDDLCHYVYILCVGRAPALIDVRDGLAAPEGDRVRERYLRVHLSTVARLATVQEVAFELDPCQGGLELRELPEPGVYDPKLLKRLRAIVDLLQASDLEHLDFGLVDVAHPTLDAGDYLRRYGAAPALVNYLFYAQPARTSAVTTLFQGS